MNFRTLTAFALLALSTAAQAAQSAKTPSDYLAAAWNRSYYTPFTQELAGIKHQGGDAKCDDFYKHVTRTGEMKIILGIGYYDFSEGEPFKFSYRPDGSLGSVDYDFGMNATLDQTIIRQYRELLTQKCRGSLEFCGFEERSEGVFTKDVRTAAGARIRATIEMRSPSVTPSHAQNVGPLKAQQDAKSAEVTNWFFGSIDGADLVVYNGHARKGGGPDFNPPLLLKNLHPNYDWYGRHTPGLSRLTKALAAAQQKPAAIMLMACNSTKLFESQVEKAAPGIAYSGMNLVPVTGLVPAKGTIAGIDSFLKMQCQPGLDQELKVDQDMREQLKTLTIH